MTLLKNKDKQEIIDDIRKIIEKIELCESMHKHIVENLTGKSHNYVNKEFKLFTGKTIKEYQMNRCASIIIQRMYENNLKLSEVKDFSPWADENTFIKVFESRFHKSPTEFIKSYDSSKLFSKIDIEEINNKYRDEIDIKRSLIRKNKREVEAAKDILSLKPYRITPLQSIIGNEDFLKDCMIENKYAQVELGKPDEFISFGAVPKGYIKEEKNLMNKYYEFDSPINIDYIMTTDEKEYLMFGDKVLNTNTQYIGIRKSLKEKMLEGIDLKDIINKDTNPDSLRTLWETKRDESMSEYFLSPNDFVTTRLNNLEYMILRHLMYQEQGIVKYSSLEEIKDVIKYDYENEIKPEKEIHIPDCEECEYIDCEGETLDICECEHVKQLSKEDLEIYLADIEYEPLTIERLCEVIIKLINKEFIYLKN